MKTIRELADLLGIHRTTLNKAIGKALTEGVSAFKSGDTWLIDEESNEFKVWLVGTATGRPRNATIPTEVPKSPEWVNTWTGRHAWKVNLEWRVMATSAASGIGVEQYRRHLLREAERMYGDR